MEAFVLIIFLKFGYSGGVLAHDFDSKAACQAALEAVKAQDRPLVALCTPKNM